MEYAHVFMSAARAGVAPSADTLMLPHWSEQDWIELLSRTRPRRVAPHEIIIARGKEPVARLTPVAGGKRRLKYGALKGKLNIPDGFFFDPLPEEELRLWEGDDEDTLG